MIRLAVEEDIQIVKNMVNSLISTTKHKNPLASFELTDDLIMSFIKPENHNERVCVLTTDEEGLVTGVGAFEIVLCPHVNLKLARLAVIYVIPEYRSKGYGKEIREALEYWGSITKCKYCNINDSTGSDLTKDGYTKYEVLYLKEIN